ncbi:MAG TPA: CPBP family intramembrane glutamic endopeptidase [Symbiobacteriaceae bacterium]|nr:CPBP family intramembrane glutamic endopeptidase [Symbiobacteriaceae bacterium]
MQATAKVRFAERHPIAYLVILFVSMMFVYILAGAITSIGKLEATSQILIGNSLLIVLALGIVARLGWWEETGLTPGQGARPWLLAWLPFAAGLSYLVDGIDMTAAGQIAMLLVCSVLVGFTEEIYFRGLFMRLLKPFGETAMILWSTLIFGVTHSINLLAGQGTLMTVFQIAYSAAVGFLLAVLRVKGKSLWPLVAAHALIDFLAWMCEGGIYSNTEVTVSMLIRPALLTVAFIANGIWLLRSSKNA